MSGLALEGLTTGYVLRPVTEADLPALLALCRSNPQYYRHCPPPPSLEGLARDLAALPPGKTAEDKYYLGYFDDARLIAALDLITGYPSPDTAFIGFFMLDASAQGCWLGSRLVSELFDGLAAQGFREVRLGWAKTNPQARAFWLKQGMVPTGQSYAADGYTVVIASRSLTA